MFKKLTLFVILISSSLIFAQAEEEVIVTGSYIKGSPTDGASPVEILSRDTIEGIGAINVADITANLAVDSGSENNADSFTSGATQGRTNVNLRGLGLTSTLVLIDGKRQTLAGATANDGSVFVDTSTIPVIALERVEILKEGAASIYGSDAVAGVVNYILRRDFTGLEVDITRQQIEAASSARDDRLSFIYGGEFGNSNVVLAYSTLDRSPMPGTAKNLAPLGISGLGTSFLLLGADTVASGPYAGTYSAFENVADPNCVANQGIIQPQASGNRCGFFYGDRFNIVNEENHAQIYGSVISTLDSGVTVSFDYMKSETQVWDNPQSPSYPALSYLGTPIAAGTGGSPFNVPVIWIGRPLGNTFPSPLAPRDVDTTRYSLGFEGTFDNGFDWNFDVTNSYEYSYGKQPDTSTSRLNAAIAGTGGPNGNETFNLFDPTANSAGLIAHITDAQETWGYVDLTVVDFVTTGSIGDVSFATGIQYRDEGYSLDRSANSITTFDSNGNLVTPADLIFLGGGTVSNASRSSTAVFAEAKADLTDDLEISGAVRYEDLESDSTVDPKLSLRYQASDDVVLRASVSTSFREASLSQLNADTVGLQGIQDFATDGSTVGNPTFIRIAQKGNLNLEPEEADNLNVGVIWTPTDSLNMKFDYWAIDYTNVITIENAQGIVQANPNSSQVIRAGASNTLAGVTTNYFNAASVDTNGFDLELSYLADTDAGLLSMGLKATHIAKYEIPIGGVATDVVGFFNHNNFARSLPDTKAVLSANLTSGDHSVSAYGRFISSYETTRALTTAATALGMDQTIDSHFTVDLQYVYNLNTAEDIALTLGIKNVFDEDAPVAYDDINFSYDPKHHDPRGRIFSIGVNYNM